jgi:hypothetical protein
LRRILTPDSLGAARRRECLIAAFIEVDDQTDRAIEFAARMANISKGEVVARLVERASVPALAPPAGDASGASDVINVHADYGGHRTQGTYDPVTTRIDITSGPLAGRSFKTPTGAARAVVAHYNPKVSPNRNGYTFWILSDGSGRSLQRIRPQ